MRFLGYQGADLPCPSQHCCPWPMNGLEGKEQLWGLSFWKVNGSKREGSILCPALQHRGNPVGGSGCPPGTGSLGACVDMLASWGHSHLMDSRVSC